MGGVVPAEVGSDTDCPRCWAPSTSCPGVLGATLPGTADRLEGMMFSHGYWHVYPASIVGMVLAAVGVFLGYREYDWMWIFYLSTGPVWFVYNAFGVHDPFGVATTIIFSAGYVAFLLKPERRAARRRKGLHAVPPPVAKPPPPHPNLPLRGYGAGYYGYAAALVFVALAGAYLVFHAPVVG